MAKPTKTKAKKRSMFRGDRAFLSNFAASPIDFEGRRYATVEAAFQAAKTDDTANKEIIAALVNPVAAKRAGRMVKLRPEWEGVKRTVMEQLLRLKFAPGSDLAAKLLATGEEELVEWNNWNDREWGKCLKTGVGNNTLGKLLMKIRAELRGIAGTSGAA